MERFIYFNSRDSFFRVEISQIVYFQADKNYTELYLTNGQKIVFTFGLAAMKTHLEETLGEDARRFVRIGKSFIINMSYVFQINILKQTLTLCERTHNNSFVLSVSKEALKNLKSLYIKK